MQTSSPARPCPCCGRTRDSDCRWNDTTILCHQGQSHGPPSHLKRGDTINIGGKQWAVIRFDGGFAGCAMVLKPHRGKARSRAYSRLLGATAPPMDKVGRLAAEEIEKAIADIDRALAVPPFEFLRPDEMRRVLRWLWRPTRRPMPSEKPSASWPARGPAYGKEKPFLTVR